ncbi:MAG: O-antigen ligase family protein [Bacillota bacterium]|nr:O-antigen ligase family protein [Bacillota bacterium]
MKKNNLDQLIEIMLFAYILSLFLLAYREGLNHFSNIIALILMGTIWFQSLMIKRRIVINIFLVAYIFFVFVCLSSSFYAINQNFAMRKVLTLILLLMLMASIVNYVDTVSKLRRLMLNYVYAGFIASLYIIVISDFSDITRFGGDLGNVNAVGLIVAISSIFCFYCLVEERKYRYIPIWLINTLVVLLTGSRKAFILIIFAIIVILIFRPNANYTQRAKNMFLGMAIVFIIIATINQNPYFYQITGRRMEALIDVISGAETTDQSMIIRSKMIEEGWTWFREKPILGYGIDNYRFLLRNSPMGRETYSHNNLIELLIGTGIMGAFAYYFSNILVIINSLRAQKTLAVPQIYPFIAIISAYLILSVGMVYYDEKNISILLAAASSIQRIIEVEGLGS